MSNLSEDQLQKLNRPKHKIATMSGANRSVRRYFIEDETNRSVSSSDSSGDDDSWPDDDAAIQAALAVQEAKHSEAYPGTSS